MCGPDEKVLACVTVTNEPPDDSVLSVSELRMHIVQGSGRGCAGARQLVCKS